ncbi:MAG TPA: serine/threonine-protein kinase [Ktedonobacteraceae bacterium]|nr:serine/threonine-protein kinase [Ktedonobacteraceae bacterium]
MHICKSCQQTSPAGARFCSWCGTVIRGQESRAQSLTGLLPSQSLLNNGHYAQIKNYQLVQKVGQGGMGAVYKAQDLLLNKRVVAIKEMSQNGLVGQELQKALTAFTHEAEILSHLKHQSLPRIYEQFEENGQYYLVMDFIEGETLDNMLERQHTLGKCLPIEQVLDIGRQLCHVLVYLHTQQPPVIFRDLKPANIMLDAHGQVYLIDFGIARLFKQGQIKDTVALGSQGYAPPEQYRHATSPRSDIYSLGATLHQMLTGDDPSEAPFQFQPFSINIPHLEDLIMNMVTLDEKQRPASVNEILKVLDNPQRGHGSAQPQKLTTSTVGPLGIASTAESKSACCISASPPLSAQISQSQIYAVLSSSVKDQKLWTSLKNQLASELHLFPNVVINEYIGAPTSTGNSLPEDVRTRFIASVAPASAVPPILILLLLSDDFLSSSDCLTIANRAIDRSTCETQGMEILSAVPPLGVLLRPVAALSTNLERSRLADIKMISKDVIAHVSLYAQEQSILEVAKTIRGHLTQLLLPIADNKHVTFGDGRSMNLLQWLLWQLYGNGHHICPYFVVSPFVLKYIRTSGFGAGVLIHLLNLQDYQPVAAVPPLGEYIVGLPNGSDLTYLIQRIAPSALSPETVQGVALPDNSQRLLLPRPAALYDRTR